MDQRVVLACNLGNQSNAKQGGDGDSPPNQSCPARISSSPPRVPRTAALTTLFIALIECPRHPAFPIAPFKQSFHGGKFLSAIDIQLNSLISPRKPIAMLRFHPFEYLSSFLVAFGFGGHRRPICSGRLGDESEWCSLIQRRLAGRSCCVVLRSNGRCSFDSCRARESVDKQDDPVSGARADSLMLDRVGSVHPLSFQMIRICYRANQKGKSGFLLWLGL